MRTQNSYNVKYMYYNNGHWWNYRRYTCVIEKEFANKLAVKDVETRIFQNGC